MTDEEKAKEITIRHFEITECCFEDLLPNKNFVYNFYNGALKGLAEGRKVSEKYKTEIEKLKKNYKKQRNRRIDELQKKNAELKKENEQLKQQVKEYLEMPCTSCCITEALESDLTDLNYQFVNLEAKTKVIEKENTIFKSIISIILDKEDICYICEMKAQVLPECMRMENSECLKNMISLWSK